ELALGIARTAVEYRAAATFLDYDLSAAERAGDADALRYLLRVLALGIARAGVEVAVATGSPHHRAAALLAHHVGLGNHLVERLAVLCDRLRVLAAGIVRTSRELAVASVLDDHFRAALLAHHVDFLNRQRVFVLSSRVFSFLERFREIVI